MEQKELSFWRARHDVDLVERALENRNPVVICVAKSTSKTFISFKVIQEVSRREFGRKVILFVVQDEKGKFCFNCSWQNSEYAVLHIHTKSVCFHAKSRIVFICNIPVLKSQKIDSVAFLDFLSELKIADSFRLLLSFHKYHFKVSVMYLARKKTEKKKRWNWK